jgi:hypothetical protein
MIKKPLAFLASLSMGVFFCYWKIYLPLEAARNHSESIRYSASGQVIGPALVVAALMLLFTPKGYDWRKGMAPFIRENKWHTLYNIISITVFILTLIGVHLWFNHTLNQLGYSS